MYSTFETDSIEYQAIFIASPIPTLTNLLHFTQYLETLTTRLNSTGHTNLVEAFHHALNNLADEAPPMYTENEERLLYYILLSTIGRNYHYIFQRVSRTSTPCRAIEIMRLLYGESLRCVTEQIDEWFGCMHELAERWLTWERAGFDGGLQSEADEELEDDDEVNSLLNYYGTFETSYDADSDGSFVFVGNDNNEDGYENEDEYENDIDTDSIRDDYIRVTYVGADYVGEETSSREETIKSHLVEYFKGYRGLRNYIIRSGMENSLPEHRLMRYAWNDLCQSALRDTCVSLLESNGMWNEQYEYLPFATLESLEECILNELSNDSLIEVFDQFNDTDVDDFVQVDDVEMHNDLRDDDGGDDFNGFGSSLFGEQFVQVGEFVANYAEFDHEW
ncbi:unnamed protein product [Ambrosiozyma monospora]|uniref:Unnamed protein product n=1 Tax=Ambrosiozyma monospora TaxID=43982 RepID=A0A9W7DIH0_AMBMO|nr:unnamed protein product [Ambrosiozyma monospora]